MTIIVKCTAINSHCATSVL